MMVREMGVFQLEAEGQLVEVEHGCHECRAVPSAH